MGISQLLLIGDDEREAERFLVFAVGTSVCVFGILTLGHSFWKELPDTIGILLIVSYTLVAGVLAGMHAYRNDGLFVSSTISFIVLLGLAVPENVFNIFYTLNLYSYSPLREVLGGVWIALILSIPIGVVSFIIGSGGRRIHRRDERSSLTTH